MTSRTTPAQGTHPPPAGTRRPVVYLACVGVDEPAANATLPAKLKRLLKKFDLPRLCRGDSVPIKMHLGGHLGYTTIHPLLVRTVVNAVKTAGGAPFIVDASFDAVRSAADRGYTTETLGCPIVAAGGPYDTHVVAKTVDYRSLDELRILGAIRDAPCLINLSHVKGHGDCGYGGACKNLAMGCVDGPTRAKLHALEGTINWAEGRCTFCGRCVEACDTGAITLNRTRKRVSISFHDCRFCRHCILACPRKALTVRDRDGFRHFQEGMALATRTILESFDPARVLHVNVLTQITMFCDCWGMSTPSLVPDIGIMASHDLVAVETASLHAIKTKNLIPGSLIGHRKLGRGRHLFERVHGKDPFIQIRALQRHGAGRADYRLVEVK